MDVEWNLATILAILYISIQLMVAFMISIAGWFYVANIQSTMNLNTPFCIAWAKTIWKMRSVYSSFVVHVFDIMTDLIVIIEWLTAEDKKSIDHIDSQLMGYISIGVIFFHKVLSSYAIWVIERNKTRAFLQLFDLIVQEIYYAHSKIISNATNKTQI